MDRKFSTASAVKRTPFVHGELPAPYSCGAISRCAKECPASDLRYIPEIVGLGATLLIGAFATDVAYAQSDLFQWENFSIWLITAGLALAAAAAVALIFDAVQHRISAIDWARSAASPVQPFCPS